MKRIVSGVVALVLLGVLLLFNVRLHRPARVPQVEAQLRFLQGALAEGAAEEMQDEFPEGYVFTWALYGLASAQVAGQLPPGDSRRAHHLAEARRAVEAVRSEEALKTFDADMNPPYGAFHASWALYVLAEYVRAAGPANVPAPLREQFTRECDRFAGALARSETPFLQTYPRSAWPSDVAVGVAALGIYDATVSPRYAATIRRWVGQSRARLDPRTGALSHAALSTTGEPLGGVRGGSLALASRVLVDADPGFAREQYALFRKHFVDARLGLPAIREYPHGVTGPGDVDSGPIVLGFAGPSTVVGAGAARAHGDATLAGALLGTVEMAGVPFQLGGRRRYAGGVLPVGDAFIAWTLSTPAPAPVNAWKPILPGRPFLAFHSLSALLGAAILWWGWRAASSPRQGPTAVRRSPPPRP